MGSDESHFNVSLTVRNKATKVSTDHILEEKGKRKRFEPRSLCLPALPLGQTVSLAAAKDGVLLCAATVLTAAGKRRALYTQHWRRLAACRNKERYFSFLAPSVWNSGPYPNSEILLLFRCLNPDSKLTCSWQLSANRISAVFATNTCLSRQKNVFCRDKSVLVATSIILSRQKFCRGKHIFVTTKDLWQLPPMIDLGSVPWGRQYHSKRWLQVPVGEGLSSNVGAWRTDRS